MIDLKVILQDFALFAGTFSLKWMLISSNSLEDSFLNDFLVLKKIRSKSSEAFDLAVSSLCVE